MRVSNSSTRALIALSMTASLLALETAWAQTAPAEAQVETPAADRSGQLEDIVVTAQRRAESAQDVPISLQSFSADTLEQTAVRSTEDMPSIVGGLLVQPTAARPMVFIRGVGNNSSNTTPTVLTFIDGVYHSFGQSADLANISSLEVLKGPQGTLFGRNATGGVIQITTRPPSEDFGGHLEIGYGNYETFDATAYVTGGLTPGVAADLAMRYSDQGEGYGTNIFNGDDVYLTRRFSARTRLRFDFSDDTNLTLSADYGEIRGTVGTTVSPAVGQGYVFVDGAVRHRGGSYFPDRYDINAGPRTPYYEAPEWGASLTFETEIAGMTFRNITAYRESAEHIRIDFDGGPSSTTNLAVERDPRQAFTQELQLLSGDDSPLQWVAGLFYYDAKAVMAPFQINAAAAYAEDLNEASAVYAQGTYEFLPDTRLTLGGRYTIETRDIKGRVLLGGVNAPARQGSLSQEFEEVTWRVALDHSFTPDTMIYASASRGFNAGFFNQSSLGGFATPAQNPPVLPEYLDAYEIGAKTDLFDHRLRINVSAFKYEYDGLQQQVYNTGATITINAGAAEIKGVDFEILARPINSLTLSLSGTYLDAEYTSYLSAPNYVPQADGSVIADGNIDASGRHVTNTPELSYTATASHVLSTAVGDFTTSLNVNYRGQTFIDPGNRFEMPTRYVVNATERWEPMNEPYYVSLWIKNLFDETYDHAVNILTPIGLAGNPAPPRTYGVTIGMEF